MSTRAVMAALALALAPSLAAQERSPEPLARVVADASLAMGEREAALVTLQDRGALDAATVIIALRAGGDLGRLAAAIVRHEWVHVPARLLDGIASDAASTGLLLRELALAPRPSLAQWAAVQVDRAALPDGLRCLAMAACGRKLGVEQARLLLRAATADEVAPEDRTVEEAEAIEDYRTAVWLLEADVADRLLGSLHSLLMHDGVEVSRLMPFFDRLSPRGLERLLGLVLTLPEEPRRELTRFFISNDVPAYRAYVESALDGDIPLEIVWLARADGLLTEQSRIDRVLALLGDVDCAPELQRLAFESLVVAKVFDASVLEWAEGSSDRLRRIRRVLDVGVESLSVEQLIRWLHDSPSVAQATAAALVRRPALEPALEATLLDLIDDSVVSGPAQWFAVALLRRGSADAVAAIWPGLLESPLFDQFVDMLGRRKAPWVDALLLAELERQWRGDDGGRRQRQLDSVRLALVARGDRRQLDGLVAAARTATPAFVRRCSHYANPLGKEHALQLLEHAAALDDEDLAVELIGWAATAADPEIERQLWSHWQQPGLTELHLAALRGLAVGEVRPKLVDALRAALKQGALDDRHEALGYELISTMPTPLRREDVALLAELAIVAPLHDPDGERERAERWPGGRFGFPLVAALARRLRGCDAELAREEFSAAVDRALSHPDSDALARQRLLVLWRGLEPTAQTQLAVGEATARLLLSLPPMGGIGEGAGQALMMWDAERREDWAVASTEARLAVALLLRHPRERVAARMFLGDRDPGAGVDPWSALAARPFVFMALQALAVGNRNAADQALGLAREFAGRDAVTLRWIDDLSKG